MSLVSKLKNERKTLFLTVFEALKLIATEQMADDVTPYDIAGFVYETGFIEYLDGNIYELRCDLGIEELSLPEYENPSDKVPIFNQDESDYFFEFCGNSFKTNIKFGDLRNAFSLICANEKFTPHSYVDDSRNDCIMLDRYFVNKEYFTLAWKASIARYIQQESSKNNHQLTARAETTYLNIIAALLETFQDEQRTFESQNKLIEHLASHYNGYNGLGESTLKAKFAAARKSLDQSK